MGGRAAQRPRCGARHSGRLSAGPAQHVRRVAVRRSGSRAGARGVESPKEVWISATSIVLNRPASRPATTQRRTTPCGAGRHRGGEARLRIRVAERRRSRAAGRCKQRDGNGITITVCRWSSGNDDASHSRHWPDHSRVARGLLAPAAGFVDADDGRSAARRQSRPPACSSELVLSARRAHAGSQSIHVGRGARSRNPSESAGTERVPLCG